MNDSPEDESTGAGTRDKSTLERMIQAAIEDPTGADGNDIRKVASIFLSEAYSGPFQHPDFLRRFDEVVENGAERAFSLSEREQKHRHDNDTKIIDAQVAQINAQISQINAQVRQSDASIIDRRVIIWGGFILAFVSLVAFIVLAVLGKTFLALAGGSTFLISAIGTGVFAKNAGGSGGPDEPRT